MALLSLQHRVQDHPAGLMTPSLKAQMTNVARISAALLGLIIGAQGIGKLLDRPGYISALARFRAFPPALTPVVAVAWTLIDLLALAALMFAAATTARTAWLIGASAALLDALAYAVLTTGTWVRGIVVLNCTCFGRFMPQPLSPSVLAQDAVMVVWALWMLRSSLRTSV